MTERWQKLPLFPERLETARNGWMTNKTWRQNGDKNVLYPRCLPAPGKSDYNRTMKYASSGKQKADITVPGTTRVSRETDEGSEKILIDGKERVFLRKSEVVEMLGNWPKEVDRMLYASRNGDSWLVIVSNDSGKSGAEVRVTAASVRQAARRIANGERPPPMPSEQPKVTPAKTEVSTRTVPDRTMGAILRAGELLPRGVKRAVFDQDRKTVWVTWENDDLQSIRKKCSRGRNTRVSVVTFSSLTNGPSPITRASRRDEQPDSLGES